MAVFKTIELKIRDGRNVVIRTPDMNDAQELVHLYEKLGFIHEGFEKRGVKFEDATYDDVIQMSQFTK